MRLEQNFEVPVPVAQAWGVLLDLEQVAPCLPGATLTEFNGEAFAGNVKVKLGPAALTYKGSGRFTEKDETSRRLSLVASGQDTHGAGGAQVRVTAVLHPADGGATTLVKVVADLDIAGKAAQFGRGVITGVSAALVKQFADSLASTLSTAAPAPTTPAAVPPPPPPPVTPPPPAPIPAPEPVAVVEPVVIVEPVAVVEPAAVAEPAVEPVHTFTPPPEPEPYVPEPEISSFGIAPEAEYHALALAEPAAVEPVATVEPAEIAEPPAVVEPAPVVVEPVAAAVEPIDLLALPEAKTKSLARKALPAYIVVGLALIALVVWLVVTH